MKFKHTKVFNIEGAIRGMRNAKNSWHLADSYYDKNGNYVLGENDLHLCQALIKGGEPHRKYLRQIMVSVDIEAPGFWYNEFDTYKVGTTANSTSTMHKLLDTKKPISHSDFFFVDNDSDKTLTDHMVLQLEMIRVEYQKAKKDGDEELKKELIHRAKALLPYGYLYTRTITMTYENIYKMIHERKHHMLPEWSIEFMNWAKTLPLADELLFV